MYVTLKTVAGVQMSKLIVREKLRDLYKSVLSVEETLEIKEAISALYPVLLERELFLPPMLDRYCQGYTISDLAERYTFSEEVVAGHLRFAYELLGDLLQLDDAIVVRKVEQPLRETAATILQNIYIEGREL